MKRLLAISLLVLSPHILYSQVTRDTTIYTATRIRTASNGNIISISVIKTGIPVNTGTVRVDTVTIKSKPDTITLLKRDTVTYYFSPYILQDSLILYTIFHTFPGWPDVYHIPQRLASPSKIDTVTITRVDTVTIRIPAPPCICNQPSPPINIPPGLHISDLPSRVGEMNVYNDSTYLGRLMYQDNQPGKIWFAFQYKQGEMAMPQLPLAYGDSLSAMSYLLHPDSPPPNPITLNSRIPQLPGAVLKPN